MADHHGKDTIRVLNIHPHPSMETANTISSERLVNNYINNCAINCYSSNLCSKGDVHIDSTNSNFIISWQ